MAPTDLLDAEIAVRRVLGDWGGELVFLDLKPVPLSAAERDHYERRLAAIRLELHVGKDDGAAILRQGMV